MPFAPFKSATNSSQIHGYEPSNCRVSATENHIKDVLLLTGCRFGSHHPHDVRTIKAIARMNTIHARYQKAGKISNDDLLYTLSVFITGTPPKQNKCTQKITDACRRTH